MYSYNNIIHKRSPPMVDALDAAMSNAILSSPPADAEAAIQVETFRAPPQKAHHHSSSGAPPPKTVDVVVARGLLSPAECKDLIDLCERNASGFTFWATQSAEEDLSPADGQVKHVSGEEASDSDQEPVCEEALLPGEGYHVWRRLQEKKQGAVASAGGAETAERTSVASEAQARAFRTAFTIEGQFPQLAAALWARIQRRVSLPAKTFHSEMDNADELFERDMEGTWEPLALSSDLLLARYLDGGHFAPHVDGTTIVNLNTRSLYTALIYLNTCQCGGETRVFIGDQCSVLTQDAATGKVCGKSSEEMEREGGSHLCVGAISPEEGLLALFGYNVLHEGVSVHPGYKKYIIRSDVLYRRNPPILTTADDQQGFSMYQRARVLEASGQTDEALRLFRAVRRKSPGVADLYQL
jgi:hypothetical protein